MSPGGRGTLVWHAGEKIHGKEAPKRRWTFLFLPYLGKKYNDSNPEERTRLDIGPHTEDSH